MGVKYLWDTNNVIYCLQKQFPPKSEIFIDEIVSSYKPSISIISEIELLSWKTLAPEHIAVIDNFISKSLVYQIDRNIN